MQLIHNSQIWGPSYIRQRLRQITQRAVPPLERIWVAIADHYEPKAGNAPPELAQDLISQGINLVGGGGLLSGLDRRLAEETSLPVHLVDAPLECVVLGAGRCLEEFDAVKDLLDKYDTNKFDRAKGDALLTGKGWKKGGDGIWVDPKGNPAKWEILGHDFLSNVGPVVQAQLKKAGIDLNRKILADMAANDATAFSALVQTAKAAHAGS